jgi:hypothetical protein
MSFGLQNTTHKAHGASGFALFNRVSARLFILAATEEDLKRRQHSAV